MTKYVIVNENTLQHHGIPGMHWGIRRFQPYPKGSKNKGKEVGAATKVKQRDLSPMEQKRNKIIGAVSGGVSGGVTFAFGPLVGISAGVVAGTIAMMATRNMTKQTKEKVKKTLNKTIPAADTDRQKSSEIAEKFIKKVDTNKKIDVEKSVDNYIKYLNDFYKNDPKGYKKFLDDLGVKNNL